MTRTEKRVLSSRQAESAERRFGFNETQLAGMHPRNHRRSRLRGLPLRKGTPKNRTEKNRREYGDSLIKIVAADEAGLEARTRIFIASMTSTCERPATEPTSGRGRRAKKRRDVKGAPAISRRPLRPARFPPFFLPVFRRPHPRRVGRRPSPLTLSLATLMFTVIIFRRFGSRAKGSCAPAGDLSKHSASFRIATCRVSSMRTRIPASRLIEPA